MARSPLAHAVHTLLLAAALGCGGGVDTEPQWETSHRLADLAAAGRGEAEAPAAAVQDVTRYVIVELPSVHLYPTPASPKLLTVSEAGALEFAFECPAAFAGRPFVVGVQLLEPPGELELRTHGPLRCPPGAASRRSIRVDQLRPGASLVVTATAYAAPGSRSESAWLSLPPDAELRVALGIADHVPVEHAAPVRFRIKAKGRDGSLLTLLERTLDPTDEAEDRGWVDVRVALEPARARLGPELQFVFETATPTPGEWPAFPAWGDPSIAHPAATPRPPERRNVVLVSLDTLRADRLGVYGAKRPTSPVLDRIAAEGTLFEAAFSQAPWTLPAHASLLTGRYRCGYGLRTSRSGEGALSPGVPTLAQRLREQGYATAAFTEDGYVDAATFQRGFGLFEENVSADFFRPEGRVERIVASARAFIAAHARERFFLLLHTYEVHWPYDAPAPDRGRFAKGPFERTPPLSPEGRSGAEELALYDEEVRHTDAVLARLFDALTEHGLDERTIVVVTSDHGEAFGEHGNFRHGTSMYQEVLHVPLIWRAPGLIAAGRRVDEAVGLVDVAPTLLDLVGIEPREGVQGVSLAPWLREGEPPGRRESERLIFSEVDQGVHRFAVRGRDWKAIFEPGKPTLLFDLAADPGERRPDDDPVRLAAAQRARQHFAQRCEQARASLEARQQPQAHGPDAKRLRKLRALGYVLEPTPP